MWGGTSGSPSLAMLLSFTNPTWTNVNVTIHKALDFSLGKPIANHAYI